MLPFLAQGATMALEDAWVLADALDLAADPAGGPRGLRGGAAAARRPGRSARRRAADGSITCAPACAGRRISGSRAASALAPGLLAGRFDWLFGADVTASAGLHRPGMLRRTRRPGTGEP